jgi:hypothetical protein
MNPVHAITDSLGNKGTLAVGVVLILGLFGYLDHRTLNAPSPKVTMLEDAWQSFDRAALSRDAPIRAFDKPNDLLKLQATRLDSLTDRGPALNAETEEAFHNGFANLRECRIWLETYRTSIPSSGSLSSTDPDPARDNARDHIDACTAAHPIKPYPPGMVPSDDKDLTSPHL